MSTDDVEYWRRQLAAFFSAFSTITVTTTAEGDEVHVHPNEALTRDERADLIRTLERAGFRVDSSTTEDTVRVAATERRLASKYTDDVDAAEGGA